jgi:hypothetical protein
MAINSAQQLGLSGIDRDNSLLKIQGVKAVGGTVTQITDYTVHTFNGTAALQVLEDALIIEYIIVGGGAGGGGSHGGGGGAGGFLSGTKTLSKGLYTITIGAGGTVTASNAVGNTGNNTTAFGLIAKGGGGGGYEGVDGASGASGGGGGGKTTGGANNISGQGNRGGVGANYNGYGGAGGGGAGAVGTNAGQTSPYSGGNGGSGKLSTITGASVYYAGGGGGAGYNPSGTTPGTGGLGGGGNGGNYGTSTYGIAGSANTGGGGGGFGTAAPTYTSAGGSGIVIIRYKKTNTTNTIVTSNLLFSADATAGVGGVIGTSWSDASGNGYTGTLINTIGYDVTDGGAILFDGSGNPYATIPDSDHTDTFTIEAWIHPTSTNGMILKKNTENDYWPAISLAIIDGSLYGYYSSAVYGNCLEGAYTATNTIAVNTWYHVAFSKGSAGYTSMKLHINGISQSYTNYLYGGHVNNVANSTKPYHIGINFDTPNYLSKFKGKIAIVRVYSKQLTDVEVLQNFNSGRENYGL